MSKLSMLAVCHDCRKQHLYGDVLSTNAIREWEMKHRRHRVEFLDPEAYRRSIATNAVGEYRHNADLKLAYAADADYVITLASLAESSTLLTGRHSDDVDNTTNLYLDYLISGRITVGTSPTTNGDEAIEVLAIGAEDDTPTWPYTDAINQLDSTDGALTFEYSNIKNSIARAVARIQATDGDSNTPYSFGPISLAQLFGVIPPFHVIAVLHSTGVNLNSTGGNHVITHQGVYSTSS